MSITAPAIPADLAALLTATGATNVRIEGDTVVCDEPGESGVWETRYPLDLQPVAEAAARVLEGQRRARGGGASPQQSPQLTSFEHPGGADRAPAMTPQARPARRA